MYVSGKAGMASAMEGQRPSLTREPRSIHERSIFANRVDTVSSQISKDDVLLSQSLPNVA
jgi:hypothetical protein